MPANLINFTGVPLSAERREQIAERIGMLEVVEVVVEPTLPKRTGDLGRMWPLSGVTDLVALRFERANVQFIKGPVFFLPSDDGVYMAIALTLVYGMTGHFPILIDFSDPERAGTISLDRVRIIGEKM